MHTKKAKKYLDSSPIIRGINGTELVALVLVYYDELIDKYKKMFIYQWQRMTKNNAGLIMTDSTF